MVTAQLAVDPWRVAVTEADSIFSLVWDGRTGRCDL